MNNNEIDVDELLKRILEEEEYVKSQTFCYDEYLPEFFARAEEDLEIIESCAIELENNHSNMDAINSMFRSFHNIKGSSGFVAQENIQNIAHETETMLDYCRKETIKADKSIVDLILKSSDLIKQICSNVEINIDETFLEQTYIHIKNIQSLCQQRIDPVAGEIKTNITENNNEEVVISSSNTKTNEFWNDFVIETGIYIEQAVENLENLKDDNKNARVISLLFKNLHSIKGLAGFAEQKLPEILAFEAQRFLEKSRDNLNLTDLDILTEIINLLQQFCQNSSISQEVDYLEKVYFTIQNIKNNLKLKELKLFEETLQENDFFNDFVIETSDHVQRIETDLLAVEKEGFNKDIINSLLRAFHAIKGLCGFADQHIAGSIAHQTESLLQTCKEKDLIADENVINLLFNSVDFIKKICADNKINHDKDFINEISIFLLKIDALVNDKKNEFLKELEINKSSDTDKSLEDNDSEEPQYLEKTEKSDSTTEHNEPSEHIEHNTLHTNDSANSPRAQQQKMTAESYMRISTGKVDSLVDMVGELVINQSLIEQYAISNLNADNTFFTNFTRMVRITKDLQNLAMFLRLVPLKSTFQKITRVARDTINELGKDIDFSVSGEDTEIDRVITEKLLDPLVHLVKNAISHGIESTEERLAANKSPRGNIKITAYNKRGSIYIEIVDDGAGINTDRVYKKALEKGLIDSNKEYTEKEIQEFIMLPGFSTLDVANNISGRGVGMDVVKTEIQSIGGKVEIESQKGLGTKFTLKIPLNHAIMNGLVVDIEGFKYIIPTINVKQIIQPTEEQWIFTQGVRTQIRVRNDIIPLVYIKQLFGQNNNEEPKLIVIIEMDQRYIALPVRNVLNRQEIVIKPVCEEFSRLDFVSGMSILGDGKVSLILDIESMFQKGVL